MVHSLKMFQRGKKVLYYRFSTYRPYYLCINAVAKCVHTQIVKKLNNRCTFYAYRYHNSLDVLNRYNECAYYYIHWLAQNTSNTSGAGEKDPGGLNDFVLILVFISIGYRPCF